MKTILHKAETRGHANHGWLNTYHTFSFANYYNPERIHFGMLRVLNDDYIEAGEGFGMHPHDNMEIITIPLLGNVEHKDSMGNSGIITTGEIQVMSAGTGVFHSEFNPNRDKPTQLLQIWVFPNKKNVNPRYDQISLSSIEKKNELYQILSPNVDDQGVWIHQNAWFSLGNFDHEKTVIYPTHRPESGVYLFVIEGNANVSGTELGRRDGLGVSNTTEIPVKVEKGTKLLIMEVPMV